MGIRSPGQIGSREYNNYEEEKKYPWEGDLYQKRSKSLAEEIIGATLARQRVIYGGIAGWSR